MSANEHNSVGVGSDEEQKEDVLCKILGGIEDFIDERVGAYEDWKDARTLKREELRQKKFVAYLKKYGFDAFMSKIGYERVPKTNNMYAKPKTDGHFAVMTINKVGTEIKVIPTVAIMTNTDTDVAQSLKHIVTCVERTYSSLEDFVAHTDEWIR